MLYYIHYAGSKETTVFGGMRNHQKFHAMIIVQEVTEWFGFAQFADMRPKAIRNRRNALFVAPVRKRLSRKNKKNKVFIRE